MLKLTTVARSIEHALADLDNDGKKELLIYILRIDVNPHRQPDEIWFYKTAPSGKYQYAGKLINGHTIISPEKTFSFNVKEYFEEFYSCYGCGYDDKSDEAPIKLQELQLKYIKGKLVLQKGDQELRSIINDNLGKLAERSVPLSADGKDDGTRKEMAINLAVFYYSFGKNIVETQRLFNKYYKQADAKKVWTKWLKQQQSIASQNSF